MDSLLILIGPLLVLLAVVVGRQEGRRPVTSLILGAVPLALVSVTLPIGTGVGGFLSGFSDLAAQGRGGVGPVSGLCLAISRPLFMAAGAVLLTLLFIGGVALLHTRHTLPPDAPPATPARLTAGRGGAIAILTALPVAGVGAIAALALRSARLTMLAVDPSRAEEAQAALGTMSAAEFSSSLAVGTMGALAGAIIVTLLLLVAGPVLARTVRPVERHGGLRTCAWIVLVLVALLMAWQLRDARALTTWFAGIPREG